ncbi:hypothetical protein HYH02_003593 [Chlamydomonas schloesseri]|uniref:Uncharacterized protein n=1 Tax=Chlamydomonas schloesseri TaxID=2026947 RepID=A0A835WQV4_9CHLO|nr:hypothetical protein HYH02_003593 [Chlamydomonas schloesseri]|eukprot:KAG2451817.1 hypothetical protein HYH02_003593 [Chlamydomonas schloesseri]
MRPAATTAAGPGPGPGPGLGPGRAADSVVQFPGPGAGPHGRGRCAAALHSADTGAVEQLGEKLDLGPFPGDLELVAFVSVSVVPFERTWPVVPSAAAAMNRAVAGLPGARCGVMAVELGSEPTAPPHCQYGYFSVISDAKLENMVAAAAAAAMEAAQPTDMPDACRQALELMCRLTAKQVGLCLEAAFGALGAGLADAGLATACRPSKALKIIELLLVYPWKCLVHLRVYELGLGLAAWTLGLSTAAVEEALRFAWCKELHLDCIRGSGCDGHAHWRPHLYATNRAMHRGMQLVPTMAVFGKAAASIGVSSAVPAYMAAARLSLPGGTQQQWGEESRLLQRRAAGLKQPNPVYFTGTRIEKKWEEKAARVA